MDDDTPNYAIEQLDDPLLAAMNTVWALNHRARSWRLPMFRVEDIAQRHEPSKGHNTHKPESPVWHRLFSRDRELAEALLEQTEAFGYDIDDSTFEPRTEPGDPVEELRGGFYHP